MRRLYIAYGSNMDHEQMARRCPDSLYIGEGYIEGYELLFKGSLTGSYATIEQKEDSKVPVCIWSISDQDEEALDHYEGFPNFYYKTYISANTKIGDVTGMVYIMHEKRKLGIPTGLYYNVLRACYKQYKWDTKILKEALDKSIHAINKKGLNR